MTPPIERIRYYDGEYLRAFDFDDEQSYHIEMRRRLNMGLHLYGIVEGLQLTSQNEGGITQVSISAGMAIDPFGREIFLLAPYTFDAPTDLEANRIVYSGYYQVWIQYSRVAATPPSVGYAACNSSGEMTRWQESCKVVLLQNTSAVVPPAVTDDISEGSPDTDTSNGVYLGTIYVSPGAANGAFSLPATQPANPPVAYVGLRAQQIQPPNFSADDASQFDLTSADNSPPVGVEVTSNLFVDENLVVGPNFSLVESSSGSPITPPPAGPNVGNLKVAGNLILQGDLYLYSPGTGAGSTGQWLDVISFVQSQGPTGPDIHIGTVTIANGQPISGTPIGLIQNPSSTYDPSTGTVSLSIPSSLNTINNAQITASIAGVALTTNANISTYLSGSSSSGLQFGISLSPAITGPPYNSPVSIQITWKTGSIGNVVDPIPPVSSLTISYVVVFS